MAENGLRLEDGLDDACPWSGKPVSENSLALDRGEVVGFCTPGCRDRFAGAAAAFDGLLDRRTGS